MVSGTGKARNGSQELEMALKQQIRKGQLIGCYCEALDKVLPILVCGVTRLCTRNGNAQTINCSQHHINSQPCHIYMAIPYST
jgi:hypothetical protein